MNKPETLTVSWNPEGRFRGASVLMQDGSLLTVGKKGDVSINDIMESLSQDELAALIVAAQKQLEILTSGTPPKSPWYKRMFGK